MSQKVASCKKVPDLLTIQLEAGRCVGNVDTIAVSSVLHDVCTGGNVELIAADTDLLIMLIYFCNCLMGQKSRKSDATTKRK